MQSVFHLFSVLLILVLPNFTNGQQQSFFVRFKDGPFEVLNNRGAKIGDEKKNAAPLDEHHKTKIDSDELQKIATKCNLPPEVSSLEFRFHGKNGNNDGFYQIKFNEHKVKDLRVKIDKQKKRNAHVVILFNVHLGLLLEVDNLETILGENSLAKFDSISANNKLKSHHSENLQANGKQWLLDGATLWDFKKHDVVYISHGVEGRFVSIEMHEMEKKVAGEKQQPFKAKTGRQFSHRRASMNRSASLAQQKQSVLVQ